MIETFMLPLEVIPILVIGLFLGFLWAIKRNPMLYLTIVCIVIGGFLMYLTKTDPNMVFATLGPIITITSIVCLTLGGALGFCMGSLKER